MDELRAAAQAVVSAYRGEPGDDVTFDALASALSTSERQEAAAAGQGERAAFETWVTTSSPMAKWKDPQPTARSVPTTDDYFYHHVACAWAAWQAARASLPASPSQGQWISVAERLPKESDRTVAVLLDNGEPAVAWATYWHGASNAFAEWTFPDGNPDGWAVTHWMPLPAAPSQPAQGDA